MTTIIQFDRKITLPMSPDYVAHWGLWEAVREIFQNAYDEADADPECRIDWKHDGGILRVSTSRGALTADTLLLGKTSKRGVAGQRGKFGEGYKLALLVLARLGMEVKISTGDEMWHSQIEHDESFGSDVLVVYIRKAYPSLQGVTFYIDGIGDRDWDAIVQNLYPNRKTTEILTMPDQKGRIYVGGLYVYTAKEFHCGYAFAPGVITLDRDRGMVNGFDLAYETSRLWEGRSDEQAVELIEAEAPDVEYLESHVVKSSPAVLNLCASWSARHGLDAIPVSGQEEIEQATKAGVKWVLVSEKVKALLRHVKSWIVPTDVISVADRLRAFKNKYRSYIFSAMETELDEIIEQSETQ